MTEQRHATDSEPAGAARADRSSADGRWRGEAAVSSMRTVGSWLKANADLATLAALLVLTELFGQRFSRIGIAGDVHVSEVLLVATIVLVLLRLGLPGAWRTLRQRVPLVPLVGFWLLGGFAALRGLDAFGLSFVIKDIGLVEYSVLLPLIVLVTTDRSRLEILGVALLAASAGSIAFYLVAWVSARVGPGTVGLVGSPQSSGMYMSFFCIWVAARVAHGRRPPAWQLAIAALGLILIWLTNTRTSWMLLVAAAVVIVVLAPRVRIRFAAPAAALALVVSFATFFAIDLVAPEPRSEDPAPVEGPSQAQREIRGLAGGGSAEGSNVEWRLAYWRELSERTLTSPRVAIIGHDLGRPTRFVWSDRKYAFRDGEPEDFGLDVAGPHNSFLEVAYRLGLASLLALLAMLVLAASRSWSLLSSGRLPVGRRAELVALVAALVAVVVVSGFNDALRVPYLAVVFWAVPGLIYSFVAIERSNPSRPAGVGGDLADPRDHED